jgi:hypothetical protein
VTVAARTASPSATRTSARPRSPITPVIVAVAPGSSGPPATMATPGIREDVPVSSAALTVMSGASTDSPAPSPRAATAGSQAVTVTDSPKNCAQSSALPTPGRAASGMSAVAASHVLSSSSVRKHHGRR